jgi:hypothetical protein
VRALGIAGALYRTLRTSNAIENLNGSVVRQGRNVKRGSDGQVVLRWVASALSDASHRARKLRGCSQMRSLLMALDARRPDDQRGTIRKAAWHHPVGAAARHGSTGNGTCSRTRRTGSGSAGSVDNSCQIAQDGCMSRQTMGFAWPESMREYIDNRVATGNHGNTSE